MKNSKILLVVIFSMFITFIALTVVGPSAVATGYTVKDITIQPGSSESVLNFCWYSTTESSGCYVEVAKASEMTGTAFPNTAIRFSGKAIAASSGYYSNKVTVTGLSPQTEYMYKVGSGAVWSEIYRFKAGNSGKYNTIFVSDAQIGASGNISSDKASWEKTLSAALGKFSNTAFLLSAGDQVDYFLESEYDAFLDSPLLRNVPIAPAVGNHENLSGSALNSYHFFEPSESSEYGDTPAGSDYWFKYGGVLYIVLNTNNANASEHDTFIGQAVGANTDAVFRILMFHQSIYCSAAYSAVSSTLSLRNSLYPVIDKYHFDLVLSGHDHCYTRTYPMFGNTAQKSHTYDSEGRIVNPTGTIYVTAGSASGSKYYNISKTQGDYAAVSLQLYTPTFSNIEVSGNILTITTYRADTIKALDSFAIVKNTSSDFYDVSNNAWYAPAVKFLADKNITTGTSSHTFSPNAALTRGQFLVSLMRAYKIMPDLNDSGNFSDAGSTYYTGYLATAKAMGIARGIGENRFLPESSISRQDMFMMLYNALKALNKLPTLSSSAIQKSYSDSYLIASYAQDAINVLSEDGIILGSNGNIDPAGLSSRAQMAQVLYNLLSK